MNDMRWILVKRKDANSTIELIKSHLTDTEKEFLGEVLLNNRVIAEKANARGVLHSGMTIGEFKKNLNDVIDRKLQVSLDYIKTFLIDMNLKINTKHLRQIEEEIKTFYTNLYIDAYKAVEKSAINYAGKDTAERIADPMTRDKKINEMLNKIDNTFMEMTTRNKVQKDDKSIKIATASLWVSIFSMIIGAAVLGLTVYNMFYQ